MSCRLISTKKDIRSSLCGGDSPGSYKRVMEGTLKEMVEYVCARSGRAFIGIYRITVGSDTYTGQEIRNLFDSPNFLRRSKHENPRRRVDEPVVRRKPKLARRMAPNDSDSSCPRNKARCTGFLRANKLASNGLDKIWP
jgi:hypothetical protein